MLFNPSGKTELQRQSLSSWRRQQRAPQARVWVLHLPCKGRVGGQGAGLDTGTAAFVRPQASSRDPIPPPRSEGSPGGGGFKVGLKGGPYSSPYPYPGPLLAVQGRGSFPGTPRALSVTLFSSLSHLLLIQAPIQAQGWNPPISGGWRGLSDSPPGGGWEHPPAADGTAPPNPRPGDGAWRPASRPALGGVGGRERGEALRRARDPAPHGEGSSDR